MTTISFIIVLVIFLIIAVKVRSDSKKTQYENALKTIACQYQTFSHMAPVSIAKLAMSPHGTDLLCPRKIQEYNLSPKEHSSDFVNLACRELNLLYSTVLVQKGVSLEALEARKINKLLGNLLLANDHLSKLRSNSIKEI